MDFLFRKWNTKIITEFRDNIMNIRVENLNSTNWIKK